MTLLLFTENLLHKFIGVQSAAVNVICELARKNPKNYLSLAPVFFKLVQSKIFLLPLQTTTTNYYYYYRLQLLPLLQTTTITTDYTIITNYNNYYRLLPLLQTKTTTITTDYYYYYYRLLPLLHTTTKVLTNLDFPVIQLHRDA